MLSGRRPAPHLVTLMVPMSPRIAPLRRWELLQRLEPLVSEVTHVVWLNNH